MTIASNATVTMTGGVAVGVDYSINYWGIIFNSGKLVSTGTPLLPNWLVRSCNVHEDGDGNPGTRAWLYDNGYNAAKTNEIHFRFTDFSGMAGDGVFHYTGEGLSKMDFTHCELYSLGITTLGYLANGQTYGMTNCLFKRAGFAFYGDSSVKFSLRNITFKDSDFQFAAAATNWTHKP